MLRSTRQRGKRAGVDHLYFHQIGGEQEAFCRAWEHMR